MTIYLATAEGSSERGGLYHGDAVVSLVADVSLVHPDQQHLAMRPEDVTPQPGDVLVVTSAEPFPVHCADQLADRMPMVASSMACLVPKEADGAKQLDLKNRAAGVTVQSEAEWASFSTAVGLPADHPHEVVGPTGGAGRRQLDAWQRPGKDAADRAALGRDIQFVLGPQDTGTPRLPADRAATVTHLTPRAPAVAPRVGE